MILVLFELKKMFSEYLILNFKVFCIDMKTSSKTFRYNFFYNLLKIISYLSNTYITTPNVVNCYLNGV